MSKRGSRNATKFSGKRWSNGHVKGLKINGRKRKKTKNKKRISTIMKNVNKKTNKPQGNRIMDFITDEIINKFKNLNKK